MPVFTFNSVLVTFPNRVNALLIIYFSLISSFRCPFGHYVRCLMLLKSLDTLIWSDEPLERALSFQFLKKCRQFRSASLLQHQTSTFGRRQKFGLTYLKFNAECLVLACKSNKKRPKYAKTKTVRKNACIRLSEREG